MPPSSMVRSFKLRRKSHQIGIKLIGLPEIHPVSCVVVSVTTRPARQALISAGWAPLKNPKDLAADEAQYGQELELSKQGIVEVDTCSGTGFNFCNFYYRKDDMELSVTTAGGEEGFPRVVGYGAQCDQAHWHQAD